MTVMSYLHCPIQVATVYWNVDSPKWDVPSVKYTQGSEDLVQNKITKIAQ